MEAKRLRSNIHRIHEKRGKQDAQGGPARQAQPWAKRRSQRGPAIDAETTHADRQGDAPNREAAARDLMAKA